MQWTDFVGSYRLRYLNFMTWNLSMRTFTLSSRTSFYANRYTSLDSWRATGLAIRCSGFQTEIRGGGVRKLGGFMVYLWSGGWGHPKWQQHSCSCCWWFWCRLLHQLRRSRIRLKVSTLTNLLAHHHHHSQENHSAIRKTWAESVRVS